MYYIQPQDQDVAGFRVHSKASIHRNGLIVCRYMHILVTYNASTNIAQEWLDSSIN